MFCGIRYLRVVCYPLYGRHYGCNQGMGVEERGRRRTSSVEGDSQGRAESPPNEDQRYGSGAESRLDWYTLSMLDPIDFQLTSSTASSDETAQIQPAIENEATSSLKLPKPLEHPAAAVKAILALPLTELGESYLLTAAGDYLRVYDISTLAEPELISTTDIHWHDVTAIRLWFRQRNNGETTLVEPYIVSTSLDQSIRKWRLAGKSLSHRRNILYVECFLQTFSCLCHRLH